MGFRSCTRYALAVALYMLERICRYLIALTTFPASILYVSKSFPGGSGVSSSDAVTVKIVLPVLMSYNKKKKLLQLICLSLYLYVCLSVSPSVRRSANVLYTSWNLTTTENHLSLLFKINPPAIGGYCSSWSIFHLGNCLLQQLTFLIQWTFLSPSLIARFNYILPTALDWEFAFGAERGGEFAYRSSLLTVSTYICCHLNGSV